MPNDPTIQDTSTMFLNARGTYYRVQLSPQNGPGLYAVEELQKPPIQFNSGDDASIDDENGLDNEIFNTTDDHDAAQMAEAPVLITGIDIAQSDIVSQVPCLNNVKVFYSFGENFGQVTITGEIFLGSLGDLNLFGYTRLVDFFKKYRVARRKLPISVSVAKKPYFVFLTGMQIQRADPEFHVVPFTLFGTLLDIENPSLVNPNGVVVTDDLLNDTSSLGAALLSVLPDDTGAATSEPKSETTTSVVPKPALTEMPGGKVANADAGIARKEIAGKPLTSDEDRLKMLNSGGILKANTPPVIQSTSPGVIQTPLQLNPVITTPPGTTGGIIKTNSVPNVKAQGTTTGSPVSAADIASLRKQIETQNAGETGVDLTVSKDPATSVNPLAQFGVSDTTWNQNRSGALQQALRMNPAQEGKIFDVYKTAP